jgi:hypothetical protein
MRQALRSGAPGPCAGVPAASVRGRDAAPVEDRRLGGSGDGGPAAAGSAAETGPAGQAGAWSVVVRARWRKKSS